MFQAKMLRATTDVPWLVNNKGIYGEVSLSTVNETVSQFGENYMKRHTNPLLITACREDD